MLLDNFIICVESVIGLYTEITGDVNKIKRLVVNEDIFFIMSKETGLWEKSNFKTQVTSTVPILNKYHSPTIGKTLEITSSQNELFFRLEE